MKKLLSLLLSPLLAIAALAVPAGAAPPTEPPQTIPALQNWQAGTGTPFTFTATSRIVASQQLRADAETFAADLTALTGITPAVVGEQEVRPGDLRMAIAHLPADSYRLSIEAGVATITGPNPTPIFHGTRTVLQLLRQSRTLEPGGTLDKPKYRERGVLVANAEKRFPLAWWQTLIREMSYLKYNQLTAYVGYSDTPLGRWQEINQYAKRYHVQFIPQHNLPGHSARDLTPRPDLALPGKPADLDLSKEAAYTYAEDITRSLLTKFDGPWWHLGSDEYLHGDNPNRFPQLVEYAKAKYGPNAVAQDVHYGFVNRLNRLVTANGKTMRIWNDGITKTATVPVDKDVVVEYWLEKEGAKTAGQLLDEGYRLQNDNPDYLYHDLGLQHADGAEIYDRFKPNVFHGDEEVPDDPARILGAKLHVWTLPDLETPDEILDGLFAPMRSLAQILWGSPKPAADYAGFAPLITTVGWAPQNWVRVSAQTRTTVVAAGDSVRITSRLRCLAPGALDGRLEVGLPAGWTVDRPSTPLPSCHNDTVDRAAPVPLKVVVPANAAAGNYEVRLIGRSQGPDVVETVTLQVAPRPAAGYDDVVRADGPAGYWPMSDSSGTVLTDASGNGRHGQYRENVWKGVPGPSAGNRAVALTGGYAEAGDPGVRASGPFTVEGWFKFDDIAGGDGQAILEQYDAPGKNGYALRLNRFGRMIGHVFGAEYNPVYLQGVSPVSAGVWHHIALVYDGTSIATYLDGTLDASSPTPTRPTLGSGSLKIGARGDDAGIRMGGRVDNVAMYQRALTPEELAVHYVAARPTDEKYVDTVNASGPLGYWRLGDDNAVAGSATTAAAVGRLGAPHVGAVARDLPGVSGTDGALGFNGGYAQTLPNGIIDQFTGPYSAEAWVLPSALRPDPGQAIVEKYDAPGKNGFALRLTGSGQVRAYTLGAAAQASVTGTTKLVTGSWYHVVSVFDGSKLKIYVNGRLDGEVATTLAPTASELKTTLKIGARGDDAGQRWQGELDEVAVYRRPLSPAEVTAHYEAGAAR